MPGENNVDPKALLAEAELLFDAQAVQSAVERVAVQVTAALGDRFPLVLPVMSGGIVFGGHLLVHLGFPLELDYLHATRYRDTTRGGEIDWRVRPSKALRGRHVLVVDDILDEGLTLYHVKQELLEAGAASVHLAVFAEKDLGRPKPLAADFIGLTLPNRYVFGFGMDAYGYWRNLPAIYAL